MTYCDSDQHGFHATADRIASDLKKGRLEDASDLLRRELHENPREVSELVGQVKNIQERQHANGDPRMALDQVIVRPDAAANGESSEVLIRDKRTGYTERIGGITFGIDDAENRPIVPGQPDQFRTQREDYPLPQNSVYPAESMPSSNYIGSSPADYQNFGQQSYSYPPAMNYECAPPPINYEWAPPPVYSNNYFNGQMYSGYEQCAAPFPVYPQPWHNRYLAREPYLNSGIYQPAAYGCYPGSGNYLEYGSAGFGLSLNLDSLFFGRRGRHW